MGQAKERLTDRFREFVGRNITRQRSALSDTQVRNGLILQEALVSDGRVSYINHFLTPTCGLPCPFCAPVESKMENKVALNRKQRRKIFAYHRSEIRKLGSPAAVMNLIAGGEGLNPNSLIGAVEDATKYGFCVGAVVGAENLSAEFIVELGKKGLVFLAIPVECDETFDQSDSSLAKASQALNIAGSLGIIPVVNTVITPKTNIEAFKSLVWQVSDRNYFLNPFACSLPNFPSAFKTASQDLLPTKEQLRGIVPWLINFSDATDRLHTSVRYLGQVEEYAHS